MARHLISTTMQPGRKVVVENGDYTDLDRAGVIDSHEEVSDDTPLGEVQDNAEDEDVAEVSSTNGVKDNSTPPATGGKVNSTPAGSGS